MYMYLGNSGDFDFSLCTAPAMQGHFSGQTPAHVVVLVFYCPSTPAFDTFQVISARWVNLSTVFLGKPPKAVYQHLVHILSPVTLDCPSWISGREKMAVETSAKKSHQVQSCKHELAAHLSHLMIKPRNWPICPAKTQISLGIRPVWSVFAVHMKKAWILSYPLRTKRWLIRLGRCPGWPKSSLGTRHFVGFVMRRLIWAWITSLELKGSEVTILR